MAAVVIGEVLNQAVGIEPETLPHLFERFSQGRASGDGNSTGLGLAIAKRMIEMHGGRLWVESTLGAGADFRFTVPLGVDRRIEAA